MPHMRRAMVSVCHLPRNSCVPTVIETSGSSEVSSIASVFSPSSTSSASTTATTATGGSSGKMPPSEKLKSAPPAAATKIRCTSKQVQKVQADKNRKDELEKIAAKEQATLGYQEEKKKKNGLSAAKVCDQVNKQYGTNVHKRLVQRYVKEEKAGQSPQKCWTRVGRDVDCGSCIPFSWPRGRFRFLGLTKGDVVHNRLSSFVQ